MLGLLLEEASMRRAAAAVSLVAMSLAATPARAADGASALSKATLDYTVSVTCTLTTPSGSSNVPCSTSWDVSLQPGWTAAMTATWNWHYTDDGLPVDSGVLILTNGPLAGGTITPTHESAGIYVQAIPTCGRAGCTPLAANVTGDTGLMAVFESNNNVPDDVSGSRTLTITAALPETFTGGESAQFGFFTNGVFVNSAPAVPEPSTWALFGVSLAALTLVRRRRMLDV
jgi:PEP-CTERM motif